MNQPSRRQGPRTAPANTRQMDDPETRTHAHGTLVMQEHEPVKGLFRHFPGKHELCFRKPGLKEEHRELQAARTCGGKAIIKRGEALGF